MTMTIKHYETTTHYISVKTNGKRLLVTACPLFGGSLCGYPQAEAFYPMTDELKAINTFKRYIKKYE
jgi:hypothetical protein